MMNRRGQVRLSALIAAGLALGGVNASASPIEDNHHVTVTDGSQGTVYGGYAELPHDNGDGTASASSNTLDVRTNDALGFLAGGGGEYQRYDNATTPGATTLTASGNTLTLAQGETTHLYGGNIRIYSTQGGPVTYRANNNTILVNAGGKQIGDLYGAHIEQKAAGAGTSFTAEAKGNRVTNTGGAINHAAAASVDLIGTTATHVSVTVDDNDVIGTAGTYSYTFDGGFGSIKTDSGVAETTVTNNDITIDGGTLTDGFSAQGGFARAETGGGTAEAHANVNSVTLKNLLSNNGGYIGGSAYANASGAGATASADRNVVTITGGTY